MPKSNCQSYRQTQRGCRGERRGDYFFCLKRAAVCALWEKVVFIVVYRLGWESLDKNSQPVGVELLELLQA